MLREAINRAVELHVEALKWAGSDVPADELETDFNGSTLPNDTLAGSEPVLVLGTLYVRREALALIGDGKLTGCVFYKDSALGRGLASAIRCAAGGKAGR